jgi:small nuclear ribonucleoprotein (snRNP)-like protein
VPLAARVARQRQEAAAPAAQPGSRPSSRCARKPLRQGRAPPHAPTRLRAFSLSSGSPSANSCLRTGHLRRLLQPPVPRAPCPVAPAPPNPLPSRLHRRICLLPRQRRRIRPGRLLPAASSSLAVRRCQPQLPAKPPDPILLAACALLDTPTNSMASPPLYMSLPSPVVPVTVHALLHNGQLIRGMFVSFDPVWNPILRDCVEIHPQAGRHVPGPLVFPCAAIASLAVEPVSSPSLPSASIGAPSLALSAHTVPSPPPPPPLTTDWVVDSGASFHTTPTTSSLLHSHPPHPSHPSSIVVGNGSTLPVTSVGASVLPGPFRLNDVLVAPGLTHPLLSVRRFTSDNQCSMEFDPWGLTIRHLPTHAVLARCDSSGPPLFSSLAHHSPHQSSLISCSCYYHHLLRHLAPSPRAPWT